MPYPTHSKVPRCAQEKVDILVPYVSEMKGVTIFVVALLGLVWTYSDALLLCYGFADDYEKLLLARGALDVAHVKAAYWQDGRYLYAALLGVFELSPVLCDLQYVRWLSFGGMGLFLVSLGGSLRPLSWPFVQRAAAAFLICCSLPFALYVSWASLYLFPFAASFALWAAAMVTLVGVQHRVWVRLFYFSLSNILLFISLCMYQPAVGFYWLPVVALLLPAGSPLLILKQFLLYLLHFSSVLLAYFLSYRAAPAIFGFSPSARGEGLVSDVFARIQQLLQRPYFDAFSLFSLEPRYTVAAFVLLVLLSALLLLLKQDKQRFLIQVLLWPAFVVLSYVPNTVAGVDSFSFRTQGSLHAVVLLLFLISARSCLSQLAPKYSKLFTVSLLLVCVSAAFHTKLLVRDAFIRPQLLEAAVVRNAIAEKLRSCPNELHVIRPGYQHALGLLRYDEFGAPSTVQEWGARLVLQYYLMDTFPDCTGVTLSSSWQRQARQGVITIDLARGFEQQKRRD